MERALSVAERGRGRTTPNPIVGAVIVDGRGVVVSQGAHLQAGGPHAEVAALDAAGDRAEGATLYCTLEPCAHTGRTGPCVDRIIAAGIARVVAAVGDPDPRVAGAGFAKLRAHGIDVVEGVGALEAADLNAPFFTWVARHRPFVTLKSAISSDGFVGRAGTRTTITGPAADRFFHRQRAEIDAIAVGSGTVLADDPQLTVRGVYRYRPLTRVLFDWRMRVTPAARLWSTLAAGPVIMMVSAGEVADRPRDADRLRRCGADLVPFPSRDLGPMLEALASRDLLWLLVEGGPALHAEFVRAGAVDRVQCVVAPIRLQSGVPAAPELSARAGIERRVVRLGDDVLTEFECLQD